MRYIACCVSEKGHQRVLQNVLFLVLKRKLGASCRKPVFALTTGCCEGQWFLWPWPKVLHHSETECRHDLHSLNGGGVDEKIMIHRRADCFCSEAGWTGDVRAGGLP